MFGKSFQLFEILGFKVKIDLSWFFVAILVAWSLADPHGLFPMLHPGLSRTVYWVSGVVGALGLFASVVLHELSHSLVARRFGLPIRGITLFIFGGVAEMTDEPPTPKAEFWVAVAGPAASIAIGIICLLLKLVGAAAGWPAAVTMVLYYLAIINGVLVLFNLIPAFPLDGGRVLRSILWGSKGDLRWATRLTTTIGSGFGLVLIALGIVSFLFGDLIGGLWWFLIGLFLRHAAQGSYQQLLLKKALEGEPVSRFMEQNPVVVQRSISIADLVEQYIYKYHYKLFPVVDGDRLVGSVSTRAVRELPRDEWDRQTVGRIAEDLTGDNTVTPDSDALKALATMNRQGLSRLLVVDAGKLVGILTLKDLLQFFALKVELEGNGHGSRDSHAA